MFILNVCKILVIGTRNAYGMQRGIDDALQLKQSSFRLSILFEIQTARSYSPIAGAGQAGKSLFTGCFQVIF